jgi:hypothetical protein
MFSLSIRSRSGERRSLRLFLNPFVFKSHTMVTFLRLGNGDMKGRGRMLLLWPEKLSV